MSKNTEREYRYLSVYDIDDQTLDYLQYVMPGNIYQKPITEINDFLDELEAVYKELDQEKKLEVA